MCRDPGMLDPGCKRGVETPQTRSKRPVAGLEFGVLGPLEVRSGGRPLPLGGPKQRALLAVLLLRANEAVSRDRLVDAVWGESPPATIASVLNVYLSRLRKLLGAEESGAALVTRPHGYTLRIDPEQLDLHRFERLVREGRDAFAAGEVECAAARLAEGLALWRGPPLADVAAVPCAESELRRLDELRLAALEDRIEAELALGRDSEVVPELRALAVEHPLRERLRAQLMLALYRTGRQSEALQCYREARRLLAGELGIDPGPELRSLEKAILAQDPSLAPPVRQRAGTESSGARRPALAARFVLSAAGVAAIAVVVLVLLFGRGGDRPGTVLTRGDGVAVITADTNKVVARVPLASNPVLVREGDGSVWVADRGERAVTQIDPESRRIVGRFDVGIRPDDLAARNGALWALDRDEGALVKLAYGEKPYRYDGPDFAGVDRVVVDDEAVWLSGGRRLIRVDPETGEVVKKAEVPLQVDGVAVGAGAVWIVSGPSSAVLRIDPDTATVTDRIAIVTRPDVLSPHPSGVAADANFVWVLNGNTATVTKIDPELRGIVATLPLGRGRGSATLTAGEGAVWVSNRDDGTVTRIDAETNAVTSIPVTIHDRPTDVAVAGGLVWVSVDGV
jgi:DNA-binding SARP family transcriptional activator/DNA-binding beta-propeller fold protein YncE